jgi:hypothetical protein
MGLAAINCQIIQTTPDNSATPFLFFASAIAMQLS